MATTGTGNLDADIKHDEGVLTFDEKNGFIPNAEMTA
jgi:hypothetical protein